VRIYTSHGDDCIIVGWVAPNADDKFGWYLLGVVF
jgi:hypothetical protein